MKGFLVILAFVVASCTTRPKMTYVDPKTGATVSVDLGGTMMAEADGVIASVKMPGGVEAKYSAIKENSTKVPIAGIRTVGAIAGGIILNEGEAIRQTGETGRAAINSRTTLGLDKGVTERANFVPTVTPPAELAR
jgi:hypothetical protein